MNKGSYELTLTLTIVSMNLEIAFIEIPLGRQNKVAMSNFFGVKKTWLKDPFTYYLYDLGRDT